MTYPSYTQDYKNILLPIIRKHFPTGKIILYGSRARGTDRPGSDIDIALDLGKEIQRSLMTQIRSDIDDSRLPINFDIVDFHAISEHMQKEILMARDSMIQRFEYCTDLFWKMLKAYMEYQKMTVTEYSPKGIIRTAVGAKIITEVEGQQCVDMMDNRNQTYHTYHQDLAEKIANKVPDFYRLMQSVVDRIIKTTIS